MTAVRVRMYNVGFGDCFLLTANSRRQRIKILFDCGSIKSGPMSIDAVAKKVVEDVTDDDGVPRIDVVVATHRHKDHVSGFANPEWSRVHVKEVWMPWTEDPTDRTARRIRDTQSKLALRLPSVQSSPTPVREALIQELALNALSNEAAMNLLHHGFAGKPTRRFLAGESGGALLATDILPGIAVYILGPSRDEATIRDMDPPIGQSYLQLMDGGHSVATAPEPFRDDWWVEGDLDPGQILLSQTDRARISQLARTLDFDVAVALDKAVNGTSLMILLQVDEHWLLFPGDAQWGTWNEVLTDQVRRALVAKTTFYKVGHHGSHNATPVEFIEEVLGPNFFAMVSTTHVTQWPSIPKAEMLAAIRNKTKNLVRSDKEADAPRGFTVTAGTCIDVQLASGGSKRPRVRPSHSRGK